MILPNQLTILRIVLTPIFLYLFLRGDSLSIQISLFVFVIAAITDWYDGWLARKFDYITEWGKFLDPLADKILTSTAFLAFVFVNIIDFWLVLLIIIRDILITLLRIYADYKKVSFSTSYSAKWKTFLQMFFLYYLLLVYTIKNVQWIYNKYSEIINNYLLNENFIYYFMLIVTFFTVITGITYIFTNRLLIRQLFENRN